MSWSHSRLQKQQQEDRHRQIPPINRFPMEKQCYVCIPSWGVSPKNILDTGSCVMKFHTKGKFADLLSAFGS